MSESGRLCGVCGAPAPPVFRAPAPEQAPDLDMRPGEPARSTLPKWLQTCRGCGAVAPDLTSLSHAAAPIVSRDDYRTANRAERWAMLAPMSARGEALLHAAWARDDAGADASALRRQAAEAWVERNVPHDSLRLLDILRRAGELERGRRLAERLAAAPLDENSARIVAYQTRLIEAGDRDRHLISSALRPPSRTPHVSHGPTKRTGLMARLLGR